MLGYVTKWRLVLRLTTEIKVSYVVSRGMECGHVFTKHGTRYVSTALGASSSMVLQSTQSVPFLNRVG